MWRQDMAGEAEAKQHGLGQEQQGGIAISASCCLNFKLLPVCSHACSQPDCNHLMLVAAELKQGYVGGTMQSTMLS